MNHPTRAKVLAKASAAFLAIAVPTQASAAECVTREQATALLTYIAPDAVEALADRCKAQVGADGFFATGLSGWLDQSRATAQTYWPEARSAFFKIAGLSDNDALTKKMPDNAIQGMLGPLVGAAVTGEVKPEDCGSAERIIELIAPLPVANLGALIAEIAAMKKPKPGQKADGSSKFTICPL